MEAPKALQVWETNFESAAARDLPQRTSLAVWLPDDWLVVPAESVVHGVETDRAADHPWGDLPKAYMAEGAVGDLWVRVSGVALLEGQDTPPDSAHRVTGLAPEVRWERRQHGRDPSLRAWLRDPGGSRSPTAVLVLASGLTDALFQDLLRHLRRVE